MSKIQKKIVIYICLTIFLGLIIGFGIGMLMTMSFNIKNEKIPYAILIISNIAIIIFSFSPYRKKMNTYFKQLENLDIDSLLQHKTK